MRQVVFKLTDEDWYPSYRLANWYYGVAPEETGMVEVAFLQFPKWEQCPDPGYRVCVWGNDDFGMERDYTATEYDAALAMFHKIISWEKIAVKPLESEGFVFA